MNKTLLGQYLRQLRLDKGLNQQQLADLSGVSQPHISKIEKGKEGPSDAAVLKVCQALEHEDPNQLPESFLRTIKPERVWAYCPNADCPGAKRPMVGQSDVIRPNFLEIDEGQTRWCGECREVLVCRCPNPDCRAPAMPGAFCTMCGTKYVENTSKSPTPSD